MSQSVIQAHERAHTGKQVARKLRRAGMVPGIYYFHGEQSVPFSVEAKALRNMLAHKSSLIDLNFNNGKTSKCVVREVQWDPISGAPLHIDLLGINLQEKVTVSVPIRLTGTAEGVKIGGGVLQQLLRELEIECLPLDIPEFIAVDVSNLEVHQAYHVGDLKLDRIEIGDDPEQVIVSILPPRLEETPAAAAEESKEPEVIGHGKKEEGEEEAPKK